MPTVERLNTIVGDWSPGDAATGHRERLIVDWTDNLFPQETPLLSSIKEGKQVDQLKVEWGGGAELSHYLNLEGAVATTTATTIVVEAGQGDRLQVTDNLAVYELDVNGVPDPSTQENMWVKQIDADTVTVDRGLSGTTARTFSDGAYIVNLGPVLVEGADFTVSPFVHGDFLFNYTELKQKGTRITEEANVIKNREFDSGNHIARLMTENARHVKRNLEDTLFRGYRAAGSVASNVPSTMSGFPRYIPSANRQNLSGYPISPYDIETVGARLWESVGDAAAKKLIMSMRTARMFDGILNKYRQADMDDTSMNLQFKTFQTRFGTFQIMETRGCPDGVVYGVNLKNMSVHPFEGMDWTEKEHMGTNGAYLWRSVYGRFTLVVRSPETMFELYGFSTDLTNYGLSLIHI